MRDSIPLTPQETDTAHQRWANARISEAELTQYLNYIYSSVAELCAKELAAAVLAQRFASRPLAATGGLQLHAIAAQPNPRAPLVHLLAKLAPLTALLAAHGHHDLALFTAELARTLEPTMDLNLARALAYVALGRPRLRRESTPPSSNKSALSRRRRCSAGRNGRGAQQRG